jgi:hypothetical protein
MSVAEATILSHQALQLTMLAAPQHHENSELGSTWSRTGPGVGSLNSIRPVNASRRETRKAVSNTYVPTYTNFTVPP